MSTYMHTRDHHEEDTRNGRDLGDVFGYLGGLIGQLTSDVGNLVTLRIDLLQVELRDSTKTFARDSAVMVAGAIIGLFAFGALTAALVAFVATVLPLTAGKAVAASALIVGVAYAIIAGLLVFLGIRHLKKRGVKPERSIEEIRRDKEWMKEIRH